MNFARGIAFLSSNKTFYVAEQLRESLYRRHEGVYFNPTGHELSGVHQR